MQLFQSSSLSTLFAVYAIFWGGVILALIYAVRSTLANQRRVALAQEQIVELLREQNNLIRQGAGKP